MALNQEEIRIRAGLDYSKVTAGLTDVRRQVFNLAKGVPTMLTSMLRTNIVGMGAMLIKDVLPTWDQIWNKIYGVDDETTNRLKEQGTKLKQIAQQARDAEKGLKAAAEKDAFDRSIASEQIKLLREKAAATESEANAKRKLAAAIDAEISALRERANLLQPTSKETKTRTVGGQFGQRTENIPTAAALAAQTEFSALSDIILKLNEEFGSADSGSKTLVASLIALRKQLDDLVLKQKGLPEQFRELIVPSPADVQAARDVGNREVGIAAARGRALIGMSEIAPLLSGVPGLGQMSKDMQAAIENVMKTSIQKVRIVEISD
jgi:hypothetical protein